MSVNLGNLIGMQMLAISCDREQLTQLCRWDIPHKLSSQFPLDGVNLVTRAKVKLY